MSTVPPIPVFPHDPNAVLDYRWDWTAWLAAGETITAKTVTVPTGITENSEAIDAGNQIVTAWITGGTIGTIYPLVCHITTTAGRQDDRTMKLYVVER